MTPRSIALLMLLIPFFGCEKKTEKVIVNTLSRAQVNQRDIAWQAALPITKDKQIIGSWKAEAKDMPSGSNLVEWVRTFTQDRNVTESIATVNESTGPILRYKVKQSHLYIAEYDKEAKVQGEIRMQKEALMMKTKDGIYVFHHFKQ